MTRIRYKQSSRGMEVMLKGSSTRAMLTDKAQPAESEAKANAPVASGAYRDSIHIEQDTTDRAVVRIVADAPHSMVVEAMTGNLARSLGAVR